MAEKILFSLLYGFILLLYSPLSFAGEVSELAGPSQDKYILLNESSFIAGDIRIEKGKMVKAPFWRSSQATYKVSRKPLNDGLEHVSIIPQAVKTNGSGLILAIMVPDGELREDYIYSPETRTSHDLAKDTPINNYNNEIITTILEKTNGEGLLFEGEIESQLPLFNGELLTLKGIDPNIRYTSPQVLPWKNRGVRFSSWQSDEFSFVSADGNNFTLKIAGFMVFSKDRKTGYYAGTAYKGYVRTKLGETIPFENSSLLSLRNEKDGTPVMPFEEVPYYRDLAKTFGEKENIAILLTENKSIYSGPVERPEWFTSLFGVSTSAQNIAATTSEQATNIIPFIIGAIELVSWGRTAYVAWQAATFVGSRVALQLAAQTTARVLIAKEAAKTVAKKKAVSTAVKATTKKALDTAKNTVTNSATFKVASATLTGSGAYELSREAVGQFTGNEKLTNANKRPLYLYSPAELVAKGVGGATEAVTGSEKAGKIVENSVSTGLDVISLTKAFSKGAKEGFDIIGNVSKNSNVTTSINNLGKTLVDSTTLRLFSYAKAGESTVNVYNSATNQETGYFSEFSRNVIHETIPEAWDSISSAITRQMLTQNTMGGVTPIGSASSQFDYIQQNLPTQPLRQAMEIANPALKDGLKVEGAFEQGLHATATSLVPISNWQGASSIGSNFGLISFGGREIAGVIVPENSTSRSMSKTYLVPPGVRSVQLLVTGNFVTNEFPDFVGTEFNDVGSISITTALGKTGVLQSSVNSSKFFAVGGLPGPMFPTGGQTGFRSRLVTVPVNAGANSTITITGRAVNVGDQLYPSAQLIVDPVP